MKRLPWQTGKVYPVFVAGLYKAGWTRSRESENGYADTGLADHFDYAAAKDHGDIDAALKVVQSVLDKAYITKIQLYMKQLESVGIRDPILVCPYKPKSNNKISRTAAVYLSEKLGVEVDTGVVQVPSDSLRGMTKLQRLFSTPDFAGGIKKDRHYIVIDDMLSSGTTVSSLRSYIEEKGGNFLLGVALASPDGKSTMLNANAASIQAVLKNLGDDLARWFEKTADFPLSALTAVEASFLQQSGTKDALTNRARLTN